MVASEVKRTHYLLNKIEEDIELTKEIESKHIFSHIPKNRRVKVFYVQKDEAVIERIKEQVELCREYYNTLINFL